MSISWIKHKLWPRTSVAPLHFNRYVNSAPSDQNAIDIIEGWQMAFPNHYHLRAGALAAYKDPRIAWALDCFGSVEGCSVLDLSPLDGGHASMLDAAGARVDAIESDYVGFMRSLVTKEILDLRHTTFWLGDFTKALEEWERSYDLIVACDALRHLSDPLHFLDLLAKRTSAIYLWAHVIPEEGLHSSMWRQLMLDPVAEVYDFHDTKVRTFRHIDSREPSAGSSDRGILSSHRRLHRNDLLAAIKAVGFDDIRIADDEPRDRHGPAVSIFASK